MTLSDRQITEMAHDLASDINAVCSAIDHGVLERIVAGDGLPPAGTLTRSSHAGGHADPTANAALGAGRVDRGASRRAEVGRCVAGARGLLRLARRIVESEPETRAVGVGDRADVARMNALGEPGCVSCARTRVASGVARWEPVDSRLSGPTTVGGRLERAVMLCCWCYERVRAWGRLPSVEELERHHEGHRVPWPADVPQPKERSA